MLIKPQEPEKKAKCACQGCGVVFFKREGVEGYDRRLYCTQFHADLSKIIKESVS